MFIQLDGWKGLIKCVLALLKLLQHDLINKTFIDIINIFSNLKYNIKYIKLSPEEFANQALSFKITRKMLKKISNEYIKLKKNENNNKSNDILTDEEQFKQRLNSFPPKIRKLL